MIIAPPPDTEAGMKEAGKEEAAGLRAERAAAFLTACKDNRLAEVRQLLALTGDDENMSEISAPNVRVERYDHGEAVYGASWSAADAWIYMTLGYDGKAVLHHVPSKEKYKILL
jgi:hypothetical protein